MCTTTKDYIITGSDGSADCDLRWEQIDIVCTRVSNFWNIILFLLYTSYWTFCYGFICMSISWHLFLLRNTYECHRNIVTLYVHCVEAEQTGIKGPFESSLLYFSRPYWRCYYSNTDAIIYVVDSADRDRIGISKDELLYMLRVSSDSSNLDYKSSLLLF